MVASAVLLIGLTGVLQGIAVASKQNSLANRMTRGAAIAQQVASGLLYKGRARLLNATTGPLGAGYCTTGNVAGLNLTDVEVGISTSGACAANLDAFETAMTAARDKIVPGYDTSGDGKTYKRYLVYTVSGNAAAVAVVVSWQDAGQTRYHTQYVGLYDPAANKTFIEL